MTTSNEVLIGLCIALAGLLAYKLWRQKKQSQVKSPVPKRRHEPVHWYIYLGLMLAYFVFPYFVLDGQIFADTPNEQFWVLTAWTLHLSLSIRLVSVEEKGAITFLQIPVLVTPWAGPWWVPFGFATMWRVTRATNQREFPSEPEQEYKGDDDTKLPKDEFRPIRITTGGPWPDAEYAPLRAGPHLNRQMTVEQNIAVRYHINHPFDLIVRMPGKTIEAKIAYAEHQMADTTVKNLASEYVQRPIGAVIAQHDAISIRVLALLENSIDSWGLQIDQIALKPPDITKPVNLALAGTVEASAIAESVEAEGRGRGRAQQRYVEAVGEGNATAGASMNMDPAAVYALEQAPKILGGESTKFVLGAEGVTEALKMGSKIVASFTSPAKKAPTVVGAP